MKNILTIIKKELKRFFTDKRTLLSLILPGLIIFVIYYAMGSIIPKIAEVEKDYKYQIYVIDEPEAFHSAFSNINLEYHDIGTKTEEDIKKLVKNEIADALIIYKGNFATLPNKEERSVEIYYNSVKKESAMLAQMLSEALNQIEASLNGSLFEVKAGLDYDLATESERGAMILATMLPYLLLIMLFSGAMAIVPESIAGEKERGTIATLLVTPLGRTDLAIGKIISLSIVSLVSALSVFLGLVLSLPKLMQANSAGGMTLAYGVMDYVYIILILISAVLFVVGILAMISAFSKTVKEASAYASPVMVLVVAIGLISMMGMKSTNPFIYLIPIYNIAASLSNVLALEASWVNITITITSNIAYTLISSIVLAKMFNSESIMFNR